MGYQIDLGAWNSVFAVPCALVDRHLRLAEKEQLQVLLWALRHAGESFDEETISAALRLDSDTVLDALDYWTDNGLLLKNGDRLSPAPQKQGAAALQASEPENQPAREPALPLKQERMLRPDSLHLAARMKESESIRYLMQEAELTLGKTLSPALSAILVSLCDDYGLPPEVIAMILHYCKDVGKTGTAYIESVAKDWAQSGILTLEAAEEKLKELGERRLAWAKVSSAAGLPRRSPTKKEEEAAFRWINEWGFSQEMIKAAYERCADHTGKFSASYLNKILERWHKQGFTEVSQAEDEERQKQSRQASSKSYDIDELSRLSFFDLPDEL